MRTYDTVNPSPWLRRGLILARVYIVLYVLGFLGLLASAALDGFSNHLDRSLLANLLFPGALLFVILAFGPAFVTHEQAERRYRHGRTALWFGEVTNELLADPQPVATETTPMLPLTIEWEVRWPFVVGVGITLSLFFAMLVVTNTLLVNGLDTSHPGSIVLLIVAVVLSFLLFPFTIWSSSSLGGKIVATDDALVVALRDGRRMRTIRWEDARLFTLLGVPGHEARRHELFYPGEYPGTAIRWERCGRPRWFDVVRPALPYEQYERQMDALLGVIAARTGLPLYDLR